jgi:hypothetical protein
MNIDLIMKVHIERGDLLIIKLPDDSTHQQLADAGSYVNRELRAKMESLGAAVLITKRDIDIRTMSRAELERLRDRIEAILNVERTG